MEIGCMSIYIFNTIRIERDRCNMPSTISSKQVKTSQRATESKRFIGASAKRAGPRPKQSYTVIHRGGEIYIYDNSTKKKELLDGKAVEKIPPGAKITIKQKGMSRVQVASILDLILGSNSPD
jgi:hypothetical protein